MSPDSPEPSTQRRAWRFISAVGAVLAAFSLFTNVLLYTQIQDSRRDNIRSQCVAQNTRHDRTVSALNQLLAARKPRSRFEARRIEQSRRSTLLLIDALAPRGKCDERAARLTSGTP